MFVRCGASNGEKLLASISRRRKKFLCDVPHVRRTGSKSRRVDLGPLPSGHPFGLSDGPGGGHPKVQQTSANGDDNCGRGNGGQRRHPTARIGGPSGGRGCRSATVAATCGTPATASGATTSISAGNGGPETPCRSRGRPSQTRRGTPGPRWRACRTRKSRKPREHDYPSSEPI